MTEPNAGAAGPILHIGYHKTGTTWFQHRFYPAVRNLQYVPRQQVQEALIRPRTLEFDPQFARATLQKGAEHPLAICEEELSGNIHTGGAHGALTADLAHRLHRAFPDGRVVIFVRNQIDMVASIYKQYIKAGGNFGVDAYLRRHPGERAAPWRVHGFEFGHLDFDRMVGLYESLFGATNVFVYTFEEFVAGGREFISRYCAELGIDVNLEQLSTQRANRSYGRNVLRLARVLHTFTRETLPLKYHLVHIPGFYEASRRFLVRLNGTRWSGRSVGAEALLGETNLQRIRETYADSNVRLAARRGLSLRPLGYPM